MRLFELMQVQPFDRSDLSSLPQYLLNYFDMPKYFNNEKNIHMGIVDMSPDEYINMAERALTRAYGTRTTSRKISGPDKIAHLVDLMKKGTKLPIPYISLHDNLQDGLHRAEAAKYLGIDKIPVAVIQRYQELN